MLNKARARKITIQIVIVVLLISAVRWYQQRNLIEGVAPDISGQLVDGTFRSLAEFRGEPVLLYFWGTWCSICRAQSDNVDAIAKDHHVMSIAMDSGSANDVLQHMKEQGRHFPVLLDNGFADTYGVSVVPTTFIIGPAGKIRFTEVGYSTTIGLRLRLWVIGWLW